MNFILLIKRLLFPKWRTPKHVAWIYRFTGCLRAIQTEFECLKNETENCLKWNGQKLNIETMLNELFPIGGGNIICVDPTPTQERCYIYWLNESRPPVYIYWLYENQPKYVYWLYEIEDLSQFCVIIPAVLADFVTEIEAQVNKVKLAGTSFEVKIAP